MTAPTPAIDLERLFKLRLLVARYGEMDLARWWNSKGMLGKNGAIVLRRGFPATHYFAQARVVFAIARSRCRERFDPPGCVTLWNLSAELEDHFEEQWQQWLDDGETWAPFFEALTTLKVDTLLDTMLALELLTSAQRDAVTRLQRSAEGRAVALPGTHTPDDDTITLLAAAFARGDREAPVIPYARLDR